MGGQPRRSTTGRSFSCERGFGVRPKRANMRAHRRGARATAGCVLSKLWKRSSSAPGAQAPPRPEQTSPHAPFCVPPARLQTTVVQELTFEPTSMTVGHGFVAAGGQNSQVRSVCSARSTQCMPPGGTGPCLAAAGADRDPGYRRRWELAVGGGRWLRHPWPALGRSLALYSAHC